MSKRIAETAVLRGAGVLAVCLAAATQLGCSYKAQAQEKAREEAPLRAETVQVVQAEMPETLLLTGNLSAWRHSEVAANAAGKVVSTAVERGQRVKKGEVLAVLDARAAALASQAAQAQARVAESKSSLASQECARGQSLYDNNVISEAEYQRIMTQCSAARLTREASEAQHKVAARGVADSIVRAPFDGLGGDRYVSLGEFVQPSTAVASVYQVDPLRVEMTVPEAQLALVQQGSSVRLQVAAFEHESFTAKVKFISPNVRRASRDLLIEAVVDNPEGKLRPGMFATLQLVIRQRAVPVVPASAVRQEGNVARLYAVVQGRVHERIVQTGEREGNRVAVLRGVEAGELVIAAPGAGVRDGARVE